MFIKSNAAESNYAGISCDKHLPSVIHLRAGHDRNAMAETKSGIVQSPSKELAYGEQPKPGTTAPRAPVTPDQRTMIAPGRARPAWRIHGPVAESVTDLILPARHDMGRTAKKRTWRHIDCDDEADQIALYSVRMTSVYLTPIKHHVVGVRCHHRHCFLSTMKADRPRRRKLRLWHLQSEPVPRTVTVLLEQDIHRHH